MQTSPFRVAGGARLVVVAQSGPPGRTEGRHGERPQLLVLIVGLLGLRLVPASGDGEPAGAGGRNRDRGPTAGQRVEGGGGQAGHGIDDRRDGGGGGAECRAAPAEDAAEEAGAVGLHGSLLLGWVGWERRGFRPRRGRKPG